jgi:hypothetical protein
MGDHEDTLIGPLTFAVDLGLGVGMFVTTITRQCSFPPAIMYREIMLGVIWASGLVGKYIKKWRTWRRADLPVKARVYIPVGHREIDCACRNWLKHVQFDENGGSVQHTSAKLRGCPVTYYPEGKLVISRTETKLDFSDPTGETWVSYTRPTAVPGAWVCIEIDEDMGVKISPKTMGTNLEGQFRVVHPVVDVHGVLRMLGDFKGMRMSVLKVCICLF